MAELADRHELYEASVQDVQEESRFVASTFRKLRGRPARGLREDFCGTASAACQWVRGGSDRFSIGVDWDAEVLEWGRQNRLSKLSASQRQRVKLIQADVRSVVTDPVDIAVAFNFSYWILKTRAELRDYFASLRNTLVDDGLLFLDMYGGSESTVLSEEKTKYDGFSYVWHQAEFDPMTSHMQCYIHFRFPDGSRMDKAFSYEWRLWSLPEIRELLDEAGFSRVRVYWETEDEDGEGTGEYAEAERGLNDPAWIVYIVAEK